MILQIFAKYLYILFRYMCLDKKKNILYHIILVTSIIPFAKHIHLTDPSYVTVKLSAHCMEKKYHHLISNSFEMNTF